MLLFTPCGPQRYGPLLPLLMDTGNYDIAYRYIASIRYRKRIVDRISYIYYMPSLFASTYEPLFNNVILALESMV